jgi:hypothetical protein
MCDYSLHVGVATRPAKTGDELVSRQFLHSITRGFGDVQNPHVAVCLRPGTELAFDRDVEIDYGLGRLLTFFGVGRIPARVARFRQINVNRSDTHHDALEFPDGRVVLVTRLCGGQRATVLQLPAEPHDDGEQDSQSREEAAKVGIPAA